MNIPKIISGGQTGADRAALDFALKNNIPCGGFCPGGRKAEDGTINPKYPLEETLSSEYSIRTAENVKSADATMVVFYKKKDRGTMLTVKLLQYYSKPFIELCLSEPVSVKAIKSWLEQHKTAILNIAGPRESRDPGIYAATYTLLEQLFPE